MDTFGNLTLVTQRLNSHLSNGPWDKKREAILLHSALPLNRSLPDAWDDDAIRQRSRTIAATVTRIWPRPETAVDEGGGEAVTDVELSEDGDEQRAEVPMASESGTARDAVLAAFERLERGTGRTDFRLEEIVKQVMLHHPDYAESTIRTHIVSLMCANAPDHHGTTYDDLMRVDRGLYRRNR
jgi:hypothetical protein